MGRHLTSRRSSTVPPVTAVAAVTGTSPNGLEKPPHETWLDHVTLLLHVAAGIEHELMIQYLYAAYSLGGDDVPDNADDQDMVREWRHNLLAIAKEEMGHLLTVQNILTVLGAPVLWTRGRHPYDNQFFPIRKYELSPLTINSLSCYVYAEAPADIPEVAEKYYGMDPDEVRKIIAEIHDKEFKAEPHRVEELYVKIVSIIKCPDLIPDSAFHPETYPVQASWEEWGKGYKPFVWFPEKDPERMKWALVLPPAEAWKQPTAAQARVIVQQVATRTEVLAALALIGEQGEASVFKVDDDQPSHFARFINIYQRFKEIEKNEKKWKPTRPVPNNPTTVDPATGGARRNPTYIVSQHSRNWAHLFNLRYRMLLTYLSHMYRLPPATDTTQPQMRPGTLHRVFSEMYNLRAIANILVRLPLTDEPGDSRRAGPPFELPYTLDLPAAEDDCWRLHRELLENSADICKELRVPNLSADESQYLTALHHLDRQSVAWIDAVLTGGAARRARS